MKITKHTSIIRFGKYEYPFTVEMDNGDVLNSIIYSITDLTSAMLDTQINAYIVKYESRPDPVRNESILITEVEEILKDKGLMEPVDEWDEWKYRPSETEMSKL